MAVAVLQARLEGAALSAPAAQGVNLTKVHGEEEPRVVALDGIGVEFPPARFSLIMGPSGSGTSTLMHCLAGLDALDAGQTWIDGTELSGKPGQAWLDTVIDAPWWPRPGSSRCSASSTRWPSRSSSAPRR